MADLLAALDAPPSGRSQATWFDSLAYCRAKLMSYGPVPWDSPGEVTAFFGKAQGWFKIRSPPKPIPATKAPRSRMPVNVKMSKISFATPGIGFFGID